MRFQFHLLISNNLLNCWTHTKKSMKFTGKSLDTNCQYFNMQVSLFLSFSFFLFSSVHSFFFPPDGLQCFMIFKRFCGSIFPPHKLKEHWSTSALQSESMEAHNICVYIEREKERERQTSNNLQLLDHFLSVGQLTLHLILKIIWRVPKATSDGNSDFVGIHLKTQSRIQRRKKE